VRWLALWLVLFGVSAATLGIDAFDGSDYGGDEPHYLVVAESIVSDRDLDVRDEYRERAYADWYPRRLQPDGEPVGGRLTEPQGLGFPLLIAPAYALGGPVLVQLFLAAIGALAFVLAARLARRIVPEPWATGGVLLVALCPLSLAYGATVSPELTAGALLVGALLCALRMRERSRLRDAYAAAFMLALLPWLAARFVVPALPVALLLVRWTARRGRGPTALVVAEIMFGSLLFYVALNEGLYGGRTPDAAGGTGTGADFPFGYLERLPRLAGLWLDRDYGAVRWAPVLALAFFAGWLLWRSWRERVAQALPERRDAEIAAAAALLVCAGVVAVAAVGAPTMFGFWFPGRYLVVGLPVAAALCAWGLRHAPRAGAALGALTMLASVWLLIDLWTGAVDGWADPSSRAPWGPLHALFPRFAGSGSVWADVVSIALAVALLGLVAREWLTWRRRARRIEQRRRPGAVARR
jgi:hypothetical protein